MHGAADVGDVPAISPVANLLSEVSSRSQPSAPGPQSHLSSLVRLDRASVLNKPGLPDTVTGAGASRSLLPAHTHAVSIPACRSALTYASSSSSRKRASLTAAGEGR